MDLITQTQHFILEKMGNTGIAHAAMGLANLLGKQVDFAKPEIKTIPLNQVADYLGGADKLACGIHLRILGEITGSMLLVLPNLSADKLLNFWFSRQQAADLTFNDYEESALKELGNITMGAYLVALSDLTGYTMMASIPDLAIDMLGALLEEILAVTSKEIDKVILVETDFSLNNEKVKGFFLLIFDLDSMNKLFELKQENRV